MGLLSLGEHKVSQLVAALPPPKRRHFGFAQAGHDTALGVRFAGIVAMLATQLLLADIVRRVTHDFRAVVFALLMPEAALYYGLLMAKVAPVDQGWITAAPPWLPLRRS